MSKIKAVLVKIRNIVVDVAALSIMAATVLATFAFFGVLLFAVVKIVKLAWGSA